MELDKNELARFKDSITKAYEHLGYELKTMDDITLDSLIDLIEELVHVIDHITGELRSLENNILENCKAIPPEEQYE